MTVYWDIRARRDTTANWALANPIPDAGQPVIDTDRDTHRWGDGVHHYLDLPEFIDSARASATYVTQKSAHGHIRVGFAGDSITFYASPGGNVFNPAAGVGGEIGDCPATYAMNVAKGWVLTAQIGYPGYTSDAIRTALAASAILAQVDVIVLYSPGFWNDIGSGYTLAQTRTNFEGIITDCIAAGVTPVLCSATPDGTLGTSTARKTAASERRRMVMDLARKYSLATVDLWQVLADYTTGQIKAAYLGAASDVHPNAAGRKAGGVAVSAVLDALYPGQSLSGVLSAVDSDDALAGAGWFLTDSNADGVGDGWSGAASGSGYVFSRVADATLGFLQRCTTTALAGNAILNATVSTPVGHVMEISGWLGKTGTSQIQIQIFNGSTSFKYDVPGTAVDGAASSGFFSFRYLIPAGGSASSTAYILVQSGTGTCDLGGLSIRDLTALGLTSP